MLCRCASNGRVSFYNNTGTVDIAVEIVGYHHPDAAGAVALSSITDNDA